MKIDVTKIEGYESMTAEEKLKALEGYEFESKDESKWKEVVNKATAEASKYKKELRDMQTEEQRKEAERKEAEEKREAQLQELLKEKAVAEHKASFLQRGYSEALANESANALAEGDFKTLFSNLGTFLEERDKQTKANLLKKTPEPTTSNTTRTITKEQFDNMSFTERNKLFEEDKDLYEQLKGE